MSVSIPVSPNLAYSSRKKNTPRRKEKRKIRKNNDTSFASDVEISSVYHDINWPATPSSGAHKNVDANICVAQGEAASITSILVEGRKEKESEREEGIKRGFKRREKEFCFVFAERRKENISFAR